ncbi:MAG: homoserine dehydrogenase, partial [Clostridia bacterium]|nr:homoserine dehydrogenase [Clostridia bacterium]
ILLSTAFGINVSPDQIPREGITKISKDDIEYASQFGYKIKLLSTAKKHNDELEFHVHPTLIPSTHPLASVSNEFNALFVKGNAVGELMLYGKGAGSMPTGSAVVGDVLEIAKIMGTDFNPSICIPQKRNGEYQLIGEGLSKYYIHLSVEDKPGALGMITTAFGNNGISIESVMQRSRGEKFVPVIYILHECTRQQLDKTLETISHDNTVKEIKSILRVEQ